MKSMRLEDEFKAVRRIGTPIVAVTTSNQQETIRTLKEINGAALFKWDIVRGVRTLNNEAERALSLIIKGDTTAEDTADPVTALDLLTELQSLTGVDESSVIFFVNAHRFVDDPRVSTAIGNLRDIFKKKGSTLVLLGPSLTLPAELTQDVVLLTDELPDDDKLSNVIDFVEEQVKSSGGKLKRIAKTMRDNIVSALRGLSAFGAEQQAFLSLRKDGDALKIDLDSLWARKVEAVNAVPGLEMKYEKTNPDSVRGLDALMEFAGRLFREDNPKRPQVVLHIDEVDKAFAGSGIGGGAGDSSGVTQDQINMLLDTMEEKEWSGIISVGGPGTGKSLVSKTLAGMHGVPYIRLDLGSLKGSLVGESEQRIRLAMQTIERVGGGRVFVLATCNRLDAIPPELKRRFKQGIWYYDLPNREGRLPIWDLYSKKYNVPVDVKKLDAINGDWLTGAEIRNACESASALGITVEESLKYIVPVAKSGAEDIAKLRALAKGRFLDAQRGGPYEGTEIVPLDDIAGTARKLNIT